MAEPQNFRDHIPSITDTGNKRKWMYPQIIKGQLYKYRDIVSYALLALLFSSPFIKINGEQMILLNVMERKFVFFGIIFWPQDFYLFVLALVNLYGFHSDVYGHLWPGLVWLGMPSNHLYGDGVPEN
jgi:hypothetical protein